MNRKFVTKMREAKRLELEAITLLLPARAGKHLQIIGQELDAIAWEIITEIWPQSDSKESKTVKKVTIDGEGT